MQVVVWIILILAVLFIIWLLRRWIRRIIFILILLALAFFIYGIFNPSGAARLWYNVRTFPQRMASWMGSTKEYLDYNTYKSKISSIGDSIGDTVDSIGDKIDLGEDPDIEDLNFDDGLDSDVKSYDYDEEDIEKVKESDEKDKSDKQTIKSFPKSVRFIEIPKLDNQSKYENSSDKSGPLTGYSKSDLIGVINKYIEKNLDDNTDILVTVEYEDDSSDPQKIILQTQKKSAGEKKSDIVSSDLLNKIFDEVYSEGTESDEVSLDEYVVEDSDNNVKNTVQPVKKATSTKLTQKEQEEAEEIFGMLF